MISPPNLTKSLHKSVAEGTKCPAHAVITTNKSPMQWAQTLDDEVLATAILDRILFHCEVVKFEGTGYRMDHRKTFLGKIENYNDIELK